MDESSAGVVKLLVVAPGIGLVVTPDEPAYHWKVDGLPDAATVKVADAPKLRVVESGWLVMAGATAMLTVAVFELVTP